MTDLCIRRMEARELGMAITWAREEGWNPGLYDASTFFKADPNGFFIGLVGDTPVAVGSAVAYDAHFAFCGLYIVHPGYRGRGYGLELTRARLEYCGARCTGIDGVLENVERYAHIGYRKVHENARYQFRAGEMTSPDPAIETIADQHFPMVHMFDRTCFPAPREDFLRAWLSQPEVLALSYIRNGQFAGYAVRRRCHEGHKVGPLFAENVDVARALLAACQQDIAGQLLIVDMPENNVGAMALAREFGMEQTFATARMYRNGIPQIDAHRVFGITTFELG